MRFASRALATAVVSAIVLLAGCSSPSAEVVGAPSGEASHRLTLAVVPGQDIGLIYAPEVRKIFEAHGVSLEVTEISGTDAVDSVVSQGFDLAYSSYVPPILGLGEGVDLRVISGLSNLGPAGTNGSTLVRNDSAAETWADLAGETIATQSSQSISALALQAAIQKDGGDSTALADLVTTPNGKIVAALAASDVEAAELVEPYASAGLENYPDQLRDLGDAKEYVLGENTPLTAFFTTTETASAKSAAFDAFRAALDEAVEFGNANPDAVKKGGAGQAGLSEQVALTLPDSVFSSSATAQELEPIVDLMVTMGWIPTTPNLDDFAAG